MPAPNALKSRYDSNYEDMTFQGVVNTELSLQNIAKAGTINMDDLVPTIKEAAQD